MDSFVSWFVSSIRFGTVIMFGALGEILTEKVGHLNLGVPGMVYIGAFAGWAGAYLYETSGNPTTIGLLIIPLLCAILAGGLAGALYSFFTVTLRANQNVTGLALTYIGVGLGSFGGNYLLSSSGQIGYAAARQASRIFRWNINSMLNPSSFGKMFLSYGFLVYLAIIVAVLLHLYLNRTRSGLNLRAIGENPATADAAGIGVTKYKYLATIAGGALAGLGGLFYSMDYASGLWSTSNAIEALGWLAVALVIFATWKPLNAIWGSYLFAFLYWFYTYFPSMIGIKLSTPVSDIIMALPYVMTILVLIIISLRKKRENQPPAALGLSYFREER